MVWAYALESEPELRFASVLIGGESLYTVVLVSAVQGSEPAVCIQASLPAGASLPPCSPVPPPQAMVCEHKRSSLLPSLAVCLTHGSRDLSVQPPSSSHRRPHVPSAQLSLFLPVPCSFDLKATHGNSSKAGALQEADGFRFCVLGS